MQSTATKLLQLNLPSLSNGVELQIRNKSNRHWNPKFKQLRKEKFQKIKLPNFDEERDPSKLTPDQIRSRMKEMGVLPPRPWMERPIFLSATGAVFEPFIPPEGDGKMSVLSLGGAKQSVELVSAKSKSMMAIRKIRSFDDDFDPKLFAEQAQEIYIKAHEALASKDHDSLHQLVTELAFPIMTDGLKYCTTRWQFLKSLEPPRVVHVRCTDVISKENVFSQVTVRFHTQQILVVYDRFGRLLYGSEVVAKDVLEYVVFEKHLANLYGKWRIHEKIIPDWMPPREAGKRTFVQSVEVEDKADNSETAVLVTPADKATSPL
nr:EOG090X0DDP [Macrothrix elegans]